MTDKDKNNKIKESVNYDDSIDAGNHLHPMNTAKNSGKNLQEIYTKNNEETQLKKDENSKKDSKEIKFKLYQKFLAELFDTTLLVYQCCGSPTFNKDKIYAAVLSSSFTVLFLVYIFINISGSHFNPAVSFGIYWKGGITLKEFLLYMLGQFIGAFLGCCFIALSRKGKFDELAATKIQDYLIQVHGGTKIDAWCYISCFFTEMFSTFILMFFVFGVSEKFNDIGINIGVAFGCTLIALIFTACNISGSSFNPARSLAPAVLQAISGGDKEPLEQIWIYIIGPFVGSFLSYYAWKVFIN